VFVQVKPVEPAVEVNLQPRRKIANAVILSHGLSDNRAGMIGYAQLFLRHGYDVL
jgi:hypothetical protein